MSTSASPELENRRASRLPKKVFKGHTALVRSVAYFRDGKRIVSGSDDKTIRIWDVESEKQEWQSPEQDFGVWCILISPNERTLAVSGKDRVVLWNLESRSVVWKTEGADGWQVAFSPDGQLIAATGGDNIVLLDAETGERMREPLQFGETVWCLAFSPDGTQLVAGSWYGNVRVFDAATGKTVLGPIKAHTNYVTSSLFTPDGKQFITASEDNSIRVWDRSTGLEVGKPMLGHDRVWQIALSHDGRCLVSVDSATVCVWDWNTRRQRGESLQVQEKDWFYSVAWSPDGPSVITGYGNGNISLWDVPPLEGEDSDTTMTTFLTRVPASRGCSRRPPATSECCSTLFVRYRTRTINFIHLQTIPIAEIPLKPSIPRTSKAKTAPNASSTSPSAPGSFFGRIGVRFRRDKHAPDAIGMQQPPPKIPKYSPVAKVALGQADARLYMDTSKDKKPGDDESGQEEWANVEVNCWDIFCAVFTSCCSSRSDSE
ncbi:WD40-repeat-containing domain protein [Hygrophoropsis aurantiaca]|uniref:WD40-repeat-containing domain protein n=1 Tax=Hygrophoropsis aurantiaca TaxID=72124 RepID=A0ACB7ZZQ7_9AGAM|nr:WD40-repeat-containing domain protein [Hygrophoropsis aurantiaca]